MGEIEKRLAISKYHEEKNALRNKYIMILNNAGASSTEIASVLGIPLIAVFGVLNIRKDN